MYPYNVNPNTTTETVNTINIHSKEAVDPCSAPQKADKKLLEMLSMGIEDSIQTAAFYKAMMNTIRIPNDVEIIRNAYLDELKHKKLLQEIYYIATGETAPDYCPQRVQLSNNTLENIQKALFDSLETADFFRELYFSFLNLEIRDMLFEMLTDKQDHGTRFNYLFAKYR